MPAVLKEPILKCIAFAQGCIFSDPLKICCTYDMASIWEVHVFHLVLEQCILKYWSYISFWVISTEADKEILYGV